MPLALAAASTTTVEQIELLAMQRWPATKMRSAEVIRGVPGLLIGVGADQP
jgi:hypothetical protein